MKNNHPKDVVFLFVLIVFYCTNIYTQPETTTTDSVINKKILNSRDCYQTLMGKVVDINNSEPIIGATIKLFDSKYLPLFEKKTDSIGNFEIAYQCRSVKYLEVSYKLVEQPVWEISIKKRAKTHIANIFLDKECGENSLINKRDKDKDENSKFKEPEFVQTNLFYVTTRDFSNKSDYKDFYGEKSAENSSYGLSKVAIPTKHKKGKIESSFLFPNTPKNSIVIRDINPIKKDRLFDEIRKNRNTKPDNSALIYIHGFATSFENAALNIAQVSYDINFRGTTVLYSWPSLGSVGVPSYIHDLKEILRSNEKIRLFITEFIRETGFENINLVAHSLGSLGLTEAIKEIIKDNPELLDKIRIILAAPDLDKDKFQGDSKYWEKLVNPITMYASSEDKALIVSEKVNLETRLGDTGSGIVNQTNLETIDASEIETGRWLGLGHSYWAESLSILTDLEDLIETGNIAISNQRFMLTKNNLPDNTTYWKVLNIDD